MKASNIHRDHEWRSWVAYPPTLTPRLVELTREPGATHPQAWVAETDRVSVVKGDTGLFWRPWPSGRKGVPDKEPEAAGAPPEARQMDALGQPLKAGEVYVSGRGGALVPVSVEGVRWLIDCVIANRD